MTEELAHRAETVALSDVLFEIDRLIEWADADPSTRDVGIVEQLRELQTRLSKAALNDGGGADD